MGHVRPLVVFDLDGTLIDSRRDLADSANALIVERGGPALSEASITRMVGGGAALLVRRALTAAGLPVDEASVARFLELYDERLLRTTRPYPGIPDTLRSLQPGVALAVLTNKPLAPTRKVLAGLDLAHWFQVVVGGDGPFPRKPDPASLRHLMDLHEVSAASTVMVGDSRIDLHTARGAGASVCLARYGFGSGSVSPADLEGDEALVDHPAALPAAIATLLDRRR